MNGSPAKMGTISGTAGHSSALKMKAESALKAKNPKAKTYDEAYDENLDYQPDEGEGVTRTSNHGKIDKWGRKYEGSNTPGTANTQEDIDEHKKTFPDTKRKVGDYKYGKVDRAKNKKGKADFKKAAEDWNMKTYGTKNPTSVANKGGMTKKELAAKHKASKTTKVVPKPATTQKPTVSGVDNSGDAVRTRGKNQNASKLTDTEKRSNKDVAKSDKRRGESAENKTKKETREAKKAAKKTSGKDSVEFLEAKQANLMAKESDRQGSKGGKKQGFFRKLSSKINKNKQKKNQEKIDAKNSPADMKNKY